jgi:predicted dehydrogenase
MQRARVGVIGLGTIGATHVAALRQVGVTDISGADLSAEARDRARDSVSRVFEDYREMIDASDLDGVVIATPPRTHRDIAAFALRQGIGVLCEKPLAVTLADGRAIAAEVRQARGPFQVGFCHRFQPQVRALRSLVVAGDIGEPLFINVSFVHGLTQEGREWITDPRQSGGGVLFDSGSHAIDLFRYLAGEVDAALGLTAPSGTDHAEDASVVCLKSGDVLGTVVLSWKAAQWHGLVEVIGSTGRARVEYAGDRVSLSTRTGEQRWRAVSTPRGSRFVAQMRHFLACLRRAEPPQVTVQDGLEATRIVLEVYSGARAQDPLD